MGNVPRVRVTFGISSVLSARGADGVDDKVDKVRGHNVDVTVTSTLTSCLRKSYYEKE